MARPFIQISLRTMKRIAEALFLAYTEEQAARLGGISKRTLARLRTTELWQEIVGSALAMEKPYRKKVLNGLPGWQGAAWMLERKYASQFARPEIQLQVNSSNTTTNNTLVIATDVAERLRARNADLDSHLAKLVPPANRQEKAAADLVPARGEPISNHTDNKTSDKSVTTNSQGAPGARTPDGGADGIAPHLLPKNKTTEFSNNSNSKTLEKEVESRKVLVETLDKEVPIPKKRAKIPPPIKGLKRKGRPRKELPIPARGPKTVTTKVSTFPK